MADQGNSNGQPIEESSNSNDAARQNQVTPYPVIINSLSLEKFWRHSPEAWFMSVEATFRNHNVVDPLVKFNHVISCLRSDELDNIMYELPITEDLQCYERLREILLSKYSIPLRDRVRELYSGRCRGMKPSDLLKKLTLATGLRQQDQRSNAHLKEMFLEHLPSRLSAILSAHIHDSAWELAARADNIFFRDDCMNELNWKASCQTNASPGMINQSMETAAVTNQHSASPDPHFFANQRRQPCLPQPTNSVLRVDNNRRPTGENRRTSNRTSRFNQHLPYQSKLICWYHQQFGNRARNCNHPCSFGNPFL